MKDNSNDKFIDNSDDNIKLTDDKVKGGDALAAFRKANDERKKAELKKESEREELIAEAERRQREEYARRLEDERRELLKIKAGLAPEDEMREVPEEKPEMPLSKRIGNFWYHNKFTVIVSLLIVIALTYFIGELIFKVNPDVKIMYVASDYEMSVMYEDVANALVPYCPDFNGDGKIYIEVTYNPAVVDESADPEYMQAMSAKLFVEFQSNETIIIFADPETIEVLDIASNVFDNPSDWFEGNTGEWGYLVSSTNLSEDIGYELDPKLLACFRFPKEGLGNFAKFETNYQNAHELWQNFISGNVVNPGATNYHRS
ncbi:MAG: hypothetical protein LBL80_04985 [Ruminococcus sp.]|jgi:hypothetical protein|nr:hypothetical protein [Ruminococcus sp.]